MDNRPESTSCCETRLAGKGKRTLLWAAALAIGIAIAGSLGFLAAQFAQFPYAWF